MKLQTASAAVSFAKRLEEQSTKFYQELSQRYAEGKDVFLSFAKENDKNAVQIERTYYGVISDAIEGCFAFDIESDNYELETTLSESLNYAEVLDKAIEVEKKIGKFYADAAEQSKSLMADVPRVFNMIAKKRGERATKLMSL